MSVPDNTLTQRISIDHEIQPLNHNNNNIKNEKIQIAGVSYSVKGQDDVFNYDSTSNKIARVAYLVFSILVFPVGIVRLIGYAININATKNAILPGVDTCKEALKNARERVLNHSEFISRCQRHTIETADHVKLDTIVVNNLEQIKKPINEQKFVVFFTGNSGSYEGAFDELLHFSNETGANVYTGNYRGVGESEGFPTGFKDLVMDGEAMIQFLLSKGVKSKNILIYGWSMGGAVGTHVAALHQKTGDEMNLANDRSFASFVKEVKELLGKIGHSFLNHRGCLVRITGAFITVGIPIALGLIQALGWNFKNVEQYKKINGHKFIIYHPEDGIIPYKASLYKVIKESQMTKADKKAKLERKAKKVEAARQRKQYGSENVQIAYRPKNSIKLEFNIFSDVHNEGIENSKQFGEFKNQVAVAFSR